MSVSFVTDYVWTSCYVAPLINCVIFWELVVLEFTALQPSTPPQNMTDKKKKKRSQATLEGKFENSTTLYKYPMMEFIYSWMRARAET